MYANIASFSFRTKGKLVERNQVKGSYSHPEEEPMKIGDVEEPVQKGTL